MGGSRRKSKKSRPKVRVGLPKKHPNVFKPAFTVPPKLRSLVEPAVSQWDDKATRLRNYKTFGFVSNPNLLSVRSRTSHIIESDSLQLPPSSALEEDPALDSGSDLEEDDLKEALGKKRRDGRHAGLQPLTAMQRRHIQKLIDKYGDDYQSMFMDIKLNKMQHSVAALKKLCDRYHACGDTNPMLTAGT